MIWTLTYGPDFGYEVAAALARLDMLRQEVLSEDTPNLGRLSIAGALAWTPSVFNGIRWKAASDILHEIEVPPHVRLDVVLRSDDYYGRLRDYLPKYFQEWDSKEYQSTICVLHSNPNPFAFHYPLRFRYVTTYVSVFRLARTGIPREKFVRMYNEGLFDWTHTFGKFIDRVELIARSDRYLHI